MSAITLKEISRVSGYSVSTVSKALNNKLDISSDTRQIIQSIADKYNYIPNNYAVALRKKCTNRIAVILPQVNTEFYSCFLYNIEKTASSLGYKIILQQTFEEKIKEIEYIKSSNDGSVDGVIMLSENSCHNSLYDSYQFPIEVVKILDKQPLEMIKKHAINSFTRLLNKLH